MSCNTGLRVCVIQFFDKISFFLLNYGNIIRFQNINVKKWKNPCMNNKLLQVLKDYFNQREDIAFAFLFGSAAKGNVRKEGDIDIAIYFWPVKDIEWENFNKKYKEESKIGLDLERLLKKEVDLIVLNRTRAVLADEIVRKGKPIIIKNRGIFMDFLCIVSDEAEYMRDWLETSYKERRFASSR